MDLYQWLFGGPIFTPVENASGLPPLYVLGLAIFYILGIFILFRYRERLKSEYVPLLLGFFIFFIFLMGEVHNPYLEDQYGYMKGSKNLFWDRPLYVWLTFYLRYYGMLLLNVVSFLGIVYIALKLCEKKGINKDYVLLFLFGNPFTVFHIYWVLPEILIASLIFAIYYAYESGWEKIGFLLNVPSMLLLKLSSVLFTLPLSYIFVKRKQYLPIIGLGVSAVLYFGLKGIFLGNPLYIYEFYETDVIRINPVSPLVNILNSIGNFIVIKSPLVFFLPSYINKIKNKRAELENLIIVMTFLLLAAVGLNYGYYWRYFLPLLPFYALKAPEIIEKRESLFKVLIFLNFIIIFPILAVWSCPINISVKSSVFCWAIR